MVNIMLAKGLLTRLREDRLPHFFAAVPRAVLLHAAFERMLAELVATAADRAHILKALRHE